MTNLHDIIIKIAIDIIVLIGANKIKYLPVIFYRQIFNFYTISSKASSL